MAYDFHYTPTGSGAISGQQVLEQTEDAINELGDYVNDNVGGAMDVAQQALTNSANAVDDAQTALNTANNAEGVAIQAQTDVGNLSGTVTNIGNRVTTAEGNISNLQGRMTTAEGNIGNLQGRMTTAESNIGNLQTAVSTAQATANSAQQTATTARQQAYVLRYSSSSVTDNSTIAYSTLDNTDNIKSGDKVIDVDGKIFAVVSVDTTNQTVTVGSALVDLALDANVMHLSGDESASGNKNFQGLITTTPHSPLWTRNTNTTDDITSLAVTCIHVEGRPTGSLTDLSNGAWYVAQIGTGCFFFRHNTGTDIRYKHFPTNTVSKICVMSNDNKFISDFCPDTTNSYNLGDSTNKWATINGLEPSALGMPDLSNGIDISSYLNTGSSTNDSYTASVNGYISIIFSSSTACGCYVYNYTDGVFQRSNSITDSTYTNVCGVFVPILRNQTLNISSRATENIVSAKFFPCQGNV